MQPPSHDDALLTPDEAAQFLKVPARTLESWRYRRTGPIFIRLGRHVRYRKADLDAFVDRLASDGTHAA